MNSQFPSSSEPSEDTPLGAVLAGTQVAAPVETEQLAPGTAVPSEVPVSEPTSTHLVDDDLISKFVFEEDSDKHKGGNCAVVNLFGSGCLDCVHLVEDADTDFRKCHYTKGNAHCPAAVMRIQFVGPRVKWEVRAKKILDMDAGVDKQNAKINYLSMVTEQIEEDGLRQYALSLIGI